MGWHSWWIFLVTETVLSLTPGPAVLLVVSQGLKVGGRRSLFSSLGILFSNAVYFAVSAMGLGAVILASYDVFSAIRWVGAAYLIWLGLRAIFSPHPTLMPHAIGGGAARASNWRLFLNGFILQASNPKSLIFFAAILPQFVSPNEPIARQLLILGMTSVIAEFFVLLSYGMLAGRASFLAQQPRFAKTADRVAGVLLIGAGVGIAGIQER